MKDLETTLKYKNPELMLRLRAKLSLSEIEAKEIYANLLKWLWLCGKFQEQRKHHSKEFDSMRMLKRFKVLDYAWHQFILMTNDYGDFCNEYLDMFIHHTPAPVDPNKLESLGRVPDEKYLESFCAFVFDHLGEDTLELWVNGVLDLENRNVEVS